MHVTDHHVLTCWARLHYDLAHEFRRKNTDITHQAQVLQNLHNNNRNL